MLDGSDGNAGLVLLLHQSYSTGPAVARYCDVANFRTLHVSLVSYSRYASACVFDTLPNNADTEPTALQPSSQAHSETVCCNCRRKAGEGRLISQPAFPW